MKLNSTIYFIIIIMSQMGCVDKNMSHIKSKYNSTLDERNIANNIHADSIFNIKKVLPLETCSKSIVNNISQIYFADSVLYIFDETQQKILCFNSNTGSFIRQIGKQGRGPYEHIYLTSIYFDHTTQLLYAYDLGQLKMFVYDQIGNLIDMTNTEFAFKSFCKIDNSFWVWSCYEQKSIERYYNLIELCDKLTDVKSMHFPTNNFFDRRDPMHCFFINKDKAYFTYGFNPQIYQIKNDSVLPFYTINNLLRNISYSELNMINRKNEYDFKRLFNSENYYISSSNFVISDARIYYTIGLMTTSLSGDIGHVYDYLLNQSLYYQSISHTSLLLSMKPITIHNELVVFIMYPALMRDQYFSITNYNNNLNITKESNPCIIFAKERRCLNIES